MHFRKTALRRLCLMHFPKRSSTSLRKIFQSRTSMHFPNRWPTSVENFCNLNVWCTFQSDDHVGGKFLQSHFLMHFPKRRSTSVRNFLEVGIRCTFQNARQRRFEKLMCCGVVLEWNSFLRRPPTSPRPKCSRMLIWSRKSRFLRFLVNHL